MPLHQGLIDAEGTWKYEVNLLKRVVTQETKGKGKDANRRGVSLVETESEDSSSEHIYRKDSHRNRASAKQRRKAAGRTMKEQAVCVLDFSVARLTDLCRDELLHAKIYETLFSNRNSLEGSTLVLCTGDANRSEFSDQGFLGPASSALEAGCRVEILAWQASISNVWWQLQKETNGQLRVIPLDLYASELLD
jgi:hypothetical protein